MAHMLNINNANGITVMELRELLAHWPDTDPITGEPSEVWIETGHMMTSPVTSTTQLNASDLLLESRAFVEDAPNPQSTAQLLHRLLAEPPFHAAQLHPCAKCGKVGPWPYGYGDAYHCSAECHEAEQVRMARERMTPDERELFDAMVRYATLP